jgi:hypothetical protein
MAGRGGQEHGERGELCAAAVGSKRGPLKWVAGAAQCLHWSEEGRRLLPNRHNCRRCLPYLPHESATGHLILAALLAMRSCPSTSPTAQWVPPGCCNASGVLPCPAAHLAALADWAGRPSVALRAPSATVLAFGNAWLPCRYCYEPRCPLLPARLLLHCSTDAACIPLLQLAAPARPQAEAAQPPASPNSKHSIPERPKANRQHQPSTRAPNQGAPSCGRARAPSGP